MLPFPAHREKYVAAWRRQDPGQRPPSVAPIFGAWSRSPFPPKRSPRSRRRCPSHPYRNLRHVSAPICTAGAHPRPASASLSGAFCFTKTLLTACGFPAAHLSADVVPMANRQCDRVKYDPLTDAGPTDMGQASQPTLSVDENERAPANQGDAGELAHAGTEWGQLLDQHQERQSRDPDQIHEAAHEQEPH
jgi:hypothetical protein